MLQRFERIQASDDLVSNLIEVRQAAELDAGTTAAYLTLLKIDTSKNDRAEKLSPPIEYKRTKPIA